MRHNSSDGARDGLKTAIDGGFFFKLLAANGQVVATPRSYASESTRCIRIGSVKANGVSSELRKVWGQSSLLRTHNQARAASAELIRAVAFAARPRT